MTSKATEAAFRTHRAARPPRKPTTDLLATPNRHARRALAARVLNRRARKLYQRYREMASGAAERRQVHQLFLGAVQAATRAASSVAQ